MFFPVAYSETVKKKSATLTVLRNSSKQLTKEVVFSRIYTVRTPDEKENLEYFFSGINLLQVDR